MCIRVCVDVVEKHYWQSYLEPPLDALRIEGLVCSTSVQIAGVDTQSLRRTLPEACLSTLVGPSRDALSGKLPVSSKEWFGIDGVVRPDFA